MRWRNRPLKFLPEIDSICAGGSTLFWTSDPFTEMDRSEHRVSVRLRRPGIDDEPICHIEWDTNTHVFTCCRRWSGEFGAYWADRPFPIVTSHQKLGRALLGRAALTWRVVQPGAVVTCNRNGFRRLPQRPPAMRFDMGYAETVREVRRLVLESVAGCKDEAALLLSGGLDSAVIASAAHLCGKRLEAFTFRLERLIRPQTEEESDLLCAQKVALHVKMPFTRILIGTDKIIDNLPAAVYLAETSRGTIVDDCAALVEVARVLAALGFRRVWMGEAADDLFGGFKFALRCYRGPHLRSYYRRQLVFSLPNELAIIQNIFSAFGISVIHPMWTAGLLRIGYNLPLSFRLDRQRLMKRVLRDAFADDLPPEIIMRMKCATRDSSQVRYALEEQFGIHRDRYRATFRIMMGQRSRWPRKLREQLKKCVI